MATLTEETAPRAAGWNRSCGKWMALILILTFCTFGWRGWYYSEEKVVARLDSAGARITAKSFDVAPSRANQWLGALGFDSQGFVTTPIAVQFESPKCHKVRLKQVARLPAVHFVRVNRLPFDESSIRYLKSLKNLGSLEFRQTDLTDEGLRLACQISSIHTLEVSGSKITDDGTAYLSQLPNLQILRLNETDVTDACVVELLECASLDQVWLHQTKVSPAAIEQLKQHCDVWH